MKVDQAFKIPFYAKCTIIMVGFMALFAILYITQDIIVPLVFAIIFAIVLHPLVNFFVRLRIARLLAIVLAIFLTFLIIALFCLLLFTQASRFGETWPLLVEKVTVLFNDAATWASGYFNTDPATVQNWIAKIKSEILNNSKTIIGQTIVGLGNIIVVWFLIPVYVFIILYYKPLLIEFIRRLFASGNQKEVNEIVSQIKTVIQRYLTGLIIEAILVAILDTAGLLILGIDYAILLGIIGAILNVIPYIGGLVAVALPMVVALATKTTAWYAVYVLAIYYFIQLIDNNYFVPKIVASKVKINALFSIIVVIAGNALWGVSGMFLAIPLLAIIKLICDYIEPLKPWGYLLGDTMPEIIKPRKNKPIEPVNE